MILALINNKGGVAKTTTAVSLAAALVEDNQKVLLVDLDSQAAASLSVGFRRAELKPSSADILLRDEPIRNVIRSTRITGLDLIAGSNELANADVLMSGFPNKEIKLKRALETIRSDYSSIIIDCPPSLSLLSLNALLAAERYLVPVTPHYLTLGGLASLIQEVNRLCERKIGEVAELIGFLLTMVDYRNGTTVKLVEAVRASWQDIIFRTEIRVNVKLSEAPSFGKTIFEHAPGSTGAKAYRQLAQEVKSRWEGVIEEEEPALATPAQSPAPAVATLPVIPAPAGSPVPMPVIPAPPPVEISAPLTRPAAVAAPAIPVIVTPEVQAQPPVIPAPSGLTVPPVIPAPGEIAEPPLAVAFGS